MGFFSTLRDAFLVGWRGTVYRLKEQEGLDTRACKLTVLPDRFELADRKGSHQLMAPFVKVRSEPGYHVNMRGITEPRWFVDMVDSGQVWHLECESERDARAILTAADELACLTREARRG